MKVDRAKTAIKRLDKKPSPKTDQLKKPGKKPIGTFQKPTGNIQKPKPSSITQNPTDQITLSKDPGNSPNRAQSSGITGHIGALMEAFGMQSENLNQNGTLPPAIQQGPF